MRENCTYGSKGGGPNPPRPCLVPLAKWEKVHENRKKLALILAITLLGF